MIHSRIQRLICVSVLGGMLVAGLVPFRQPRNGVRVAPGHDETSCSLEIWVKSGATNGTSTLFAFSTGENPMQLWVHQYRSALVLKRMVGGVERHHGTVGIEGVFGQSKPIFITITSGRTEHINLC
jgi:hypothetical protein